MFCLKVISMFAFPTNIKSIQSEKNVPNENVLSVNSGNQTLDLVCKSDTKMYSIVRNHIRDPNNIRFLARSTFSNIFIDEENTVIIKLFKVNSKKRLDCFINETNVLRALLKENIVHCSQILDSYYSVKSNSFIILQRYAGKDGFELLNLNLMNASVWMACLKQLVPTLNIVHSIGICHMDIKVENICFDDNNNWSFIDWGLSRDKDCFLNNLSGTAPYIHPALYDSRNLTRIPKTHCDYYSFAITLFSLFGIYYHEVCDVCQSHEYKCDTCKPLLNYADVLFKFSLSKIYHISQANSLHEIQEMCGNTWNMSYKNSQCVLKMLKILADIVLYPHMSNLHKNDVLFQNIKIEYIGKNKWFNPNYTPCALESSWLKLISSL